MANRFWVGGTANWDGTAGTKWAATSGGAGGQSVPTNADDVFFDAASGAVTCTIATGGGTCRALNCTGFTGTLSGSATLTVFGNITLVAGMTYNATSPIVIAGVCTITSAGKTVGSVTVQNSTDAFLGDALTSSGTVTLSSGSFTTNNYNVTAAQLSSNNTNIRTINLGSSTVTLSNTTPWSVTSTNLTFNAGTSVIELSSTTPTFDGGGLTYRTLSLTSTALSNATINSANTFTNFTVAGRTSAGISNVIFSNDQTITGTFTVSAGASAAMRTFVRSGTIGTTRTLTCAAVSLTDADFRDIVIAGAAAPASGTRLGDCKGNTGISFGSGVTRYWNLVGGGNWSDTGWASTSGGTPSANNFPLAQDTAVFEATGLNSGATITINAAYNIGGINMNARTSNTMTLATDSNTPTIYGNWVNGTGTTLTGSVSLNFFGRGSQTITSANATFTQAVVLNSPGGSLTLQDAFQSSRNNVGAINISAGIFDANNYNVTLTGASSGVTSSSGSVRTIAIGSGTWTIPGSTAWSISNTSGLTVTGTGTISLTSASSKSFNGGGVQTYPAINQGGTGTLTINGSNKFANITNTAIGRVQFAAGDTNIFSTFNLSGTAGNLLQLGSSSAFQTTLQKGSAWQMGVNSTNDGNNTGLSFVSGGGVDYLSVSYINGTVVTPANAGNFIFLF